MHVFPAARLPQWCAGLTAKSSSLPTGFDERLFSRLERSLLLCKTATNYRDHSKFYNSYFPLSFRAVND
jgi:hypothetical protein